MITDAQIAKLLESIRKGHSNRDACTLARIAERTFYKWMGDTNRSERVTEIQRAVVEAEVMGVDHHLDVIHRADDPRNSRWFLAMKRPDRYSMRDDGAVLDKQLDDFMLEIKEKKRTEGDTLDAASEALIMLDDMGAAQGDHELDDKIDAAAIQSAMNALDQVPAP